MKRTIRKNTTITETITNENGESFIIDRKQTVKNTSKLITETITDAELEEWKKLDQIYRAEISKELEDYSKRNQKKNING